MLVVCSSVMCGLACVYMFVTAAAWSPALAASIGVNSVQKTIVCVNIYTIKIHRGWPWDTNFLLQFYSFFYLKFPFRRYSIQ